MPLLGIWWITIRLSVIPRRTSEPQLKLWHCCCKFELAANKGWPTSKLKLTDELWGGSKDAFVIANKCFQLAEVYPLSRPGGPFLQ